MVLICLPMAHLSDMKILSVTVYAITVVFVQTINKGIGNGLNLSSNGTPFRH